MYLYQALQPQKTDSNLIQMFLLLKDNKLCFG